MSSSYSSLLSLSAADQVCGGEFLVDGGADVSSFLSFDGADVGEEYYRQAEAAAAAFGSERQAPATLLGALRADEGYRVGSKAGISSGGESGRQSRLEVEASVLSSAGVLADHGRIDDGFTRDGGARGLPRSKNGKIAFKTRSDVDVLDDGYRWRKYGKKMVKNSPNPRNYYRCSSEGCHVKKRVERERDDARFVITTYDGVHNHPAAPPPRPPQAYRLGEP